MLSSFHDNILDFVGIRDHSKHESFLFCCGLYRNITKIEYSREYAVDTCRHILNVTKIELTDMSIKETSLFYVDDTFIGDDPGIKIIINPGEKSEKPNKQKKSVFKKEKKLFLRYVEKIRKKKKKKNKTRKKERRKEENKNKTRENIEPMTMNDFDYFLAISLPSEMKTMKCMYHKNF